MVVEKHGRPLFLPIPETPNRKDLDPPPARRDPPSFPTNDSYIQGASRPRLSTPVAPHHADLSFIVVVEKKALFVVGGVMLLITEKRNVSLIPLALYAIRRLVAVHQNK